MKTNRCAIALLVGLSVFSVSACASGSRFSAGNLNVRAEESFSNATDNPALAPTADTSSDANSLIAAGTPTIDSSGNPVVVDSSGKIMVDSSGKPLIPGSPIVPLTSGIAGAIPVVPTSATPGSRSSSSAPALTHRPTSPTAGGGGAVLPPPPAENPTTPQPPRHTSNPDPPSNPEPPTDPNPSVESTPDPTSDPIPSQTDPITSAGVINP